MLPKKNPFFLKEDRKLIKIKAGKFDLEMWAKTGCYSMSSNIPGEKNESKPLISIA